MPSVPHGSLIETDPNPSSLPSTSTGSFDLSSEQLGILTEEESFNLLPEPASYIAMSAQEQIQQLTQLVQALLNAQATQAGQAPVPTPRPPKVATPSPFNGDREKLEDFLAQCRLYLSLRHVEYPDDQQQILFVLSHMKEGTAAPWASQKINTYLSPNAVIPTLEDFLQELKDMFADPNRAATAIQKLSDARQGTNPVETIIQLFELHGPSSGLGEAGLVDKFQRTITHRLRESIYGSHPFPTTWEEWKQRALLLDNQHRRFDHIQGQMRQGRPFGAFSHQTRNQPQRSNVAITHQNTTRPPHVQTSTPFSLPANPQPMELDRARHPRRNPQSGLCFGCGQPGHIVRNCPSARAQRIRVAEDPLAARETEGSQHLPPPLSPENLRAISQAVRDQLAENEDHAEAKTPQEEGF